MSKQTHGRLTIFQAAAVDDPRLGSAAFRVLACLGTYSDKDGWAWPSQTTIAARLGVSRQAVNKSIQQLAELGYLVVHHQYGDDGGMRVSRYRLCLDMDSADMSPLQRDVAPPQSEVAPPVNPTLHPLQPQKLHPPQRDVAQNVSTLTTQEERPRKNDRSYDLDGQFALFWAAYPKRKKKQDALAWFVKHKPAPALVAAMVDALGRAVMSGEWQKEGGRYIPYPTTWLNDKRWEDEEDVDLPVAPTPMMEFIGKDKERAEVMRRVAARRGYELPGADATVGPHGREISHDPLRIGNGRLPG